MDSYPRETKELVSPLFKRTVPAAFKLQVTEYRLRPLDAGWLDPLVLDGNKGVMIDHLPVGTYKLWCRPTVSPEVPVIDCGVFAVT